MLQLANIKTFFFKPGEKCTTIKVRAIRDFLDDGNAETYLKFKPIKAPHCPCWDGYQLPPVHVSSAYMPTLYLHC